MTIYLIYIPLCFYLYQYTVVFDAGTNKFTFHYVSTYTYTWGCVLKALSSFTFHYVSTYTNIKCETARIQQNLHSTMFLLIRGVISSAFATNLPFTFHYVSTYTRIETKIK